MNMHVREELLPQPGAVIASQYRIDSLLGMGGMGAVFAGAHLRTGRAVAIKWMLPQAAAVGRQLWEVKLPKDIPKGLYQLWVSHKKSRATARLVIQ